MLPHSPARLEAIVTGLVQGVYFREYTRREAVRLRLVGWVANRPDGAVQVVAEGDKAGLHQLLDFLHRGSPAAHVERVTAVWAPAAGEFTDFRVRYL
jgi:acylphosphatase